jgi:hypothetical protein
MASDAKIFDDLIARLRMKVAGSVVLLIIKRESDHLAIQVGDDADAIVGIRIKDPARPLFAMSYPKLTVKKDGSRHITLTEFEGAVFEGVEWVIGQLAEHGVIMPEFVD